MITATVKSGKYKINWYTYKASGVVGFGDVWWLFRIYSPKIEKLINIVVSAKTPDKATDLLTDSGWGYLIHTDQKCWNCQEWGDGGLPDAECYCGYAGKDNVQIDITESLIYPCEVDLYANDTDMAIGNPLNHGNPNFYLD